MRSEEEIPREYSRKKHNMSFLDKMIKPILNKNKEATIHHPPIDAHNQTQKQSLIH